MPVSAAITILGNAKYNPKSKRSIFLTDVAKSWKTRQKKTPIQFEFEFWKFKIFDHVKYFFESILAPEPISVESGDMMAHFLYFDAVSVVVVDVFDPIVVGWDRLWMSFLNVHTDPHVSEKFRFSTCFVDVYEYEYNRHKTWISNTEITYIHSVRGKKHVCIYCTISEYLSYCLFWWECYCAIALHNAHLSLVK